MAYPQLHLHIDLVGCLAITKKAIKDYAFSFILHKLIAFLSVLRLLVRREISRTNFL